MIALPLGKDKLQMRRWWRKMASGGREVDDGSDTSSFFSTGKAPCSGGSSSAFGADALGSGRVVMGRGWLEARPQQLSFPQGRVSWDLQ